MIDVFYPCPQPFVEIVQRQRLLAIQVGEELFPHRPKIAFDFSSALGLIRRGMHDEDAHRGGDARQLLAAINLGVVQVEAHRQAAGGDGLAQAIQKGIQSLVGIELRMRNESAGIIQGGVQEGLHLAAAGALDVRPTEHVGLPDLVAQFGFELLVRRWSE